MSKIDQLQRLAQLREQGLLTEAEFNDAKTALISADASEAAISEEKPISTPLTEATTNPPPEPSPAPPPVPESSFISEEEITPVSLKEKHDNYGRQIKPEFDQYGRNNNDSNATSIVVGLGFMVFIFILIALVSQTPQNNTQSSNKNSTDPNPSSKYSGNKASTSNTSYKAQCAFQEVRGGPLVDHRGCRVKSRVNANGHTVYDVFERDGYKRSIVLWQDSSAEVFASGKRFTGRWTDQGKQALVNINGGLFTFKF